MIEPSVVEERIRAGLEGVSYVAIRDLTGTKDHYEATIVAQAFEGKSRIKQHQLVYAALGELMAGPVHALSLKTFTPETWAARG
jgi:stress-induced morphogen